MRRQDLAMVVALLAGVGGCKAEAKPSTNEEQDESAPDKKKNKKKKEMRDDEEKASPKAAAQWIDSKGASRKLVSLDLSKDAMGNGCFPGLSVMVPEGTKVTGESSGACSFSDKQELDMYFEYTEAATSPFMVLDKRSGARVVEESSTRLVVQKKDGFVVYDFAKWRSGYRHCSNKSKPVPTEEMLKQVLAVCGSAVVAER